MGKVVAFKERTSAVESNELEESAEEQMTAAEASYDDVSGDADEQTEETTLEDVAEDVSAEGDEEEVDDEATPDELELSDDSDEETGAAPFEFSLQAKLSALLFVAPRPLTAAALAEAASASVEAVEEALEALKETFNSEQHGFALKEIAGAFQFRTAPGLARTIQRLIPPRAKRLSKAAAETLAVIAYKQPVQRAEIEAIRGVDALPTIKTLLDARLIRIVGREATAGQPALYGTTQTFLEKFGLKDLSELPTVRELAQLAEEPGEAADPTDPEAAAEQSAHEEEE